MSTERIVEIVEIGDRGDGVAEGPVYVPYTAPGDRARISLGRRRRGGGVAGELIDLVEPGAVRAEPACPHFGRCGGCALQHVQDAFYRDWKRQRVATALARRGLADVPIAPLATTPAGTRRRANLVAMRRRDGTVRLGYHGRASQRVVDIEACPILAPVLVGLLGPLRWLFASLLAPGARGGAMITATDGGADVMIEADLELDPAVRETLAGFAAATDLARLTVRRPKSDFIDPIVLRRPATVAFAGVTVDLPPGGFLQASPAAERLLVAEVTAAANGARRIADLFAGCGTFSFALARRASVHAVEGQAVLADAIRSAVNRMRLNHLTVSHRDLFQRPLDAAALHEFDAVVFDPPRAGARAQCRELAAAAVPVVIGVSCDPGTFARDARTLVDGGYRLDRVLPVDQFLWSPHVELVGIFRR